MKITLEPTGPDLITNYGLPYPGVCIWIPGEGHSLDKVLETLITPALQAFGYKLSRLESITDKTP